MSEKLNVKMREGACHNEASHNDNVNLNISFTFAGEAIMPQRQKLIVV